MAVKNPHISNICGFHELCFIKDLTSEKDLSQTSHMHGTNLIFKALDKVIFQSK